MSALVRRGGRGRRVGGRALTRRLTDAQRAQLDALRDAYRAELPQKLEAIAAAAAPLQADGADAAHLEPFYHLIHKLAGSAAIYGFDEVERAAAALEEWALASLSAGVSEPRRQQLPLLLAALQAAFMANPRAAAGAARAPDR
jgi:HPt (histidine-containing phosphotransfer) domain-containing protein